jgi:transcriptional regulator with XRE-family HTH domain
MRLTEFMTQEGWRDDAMAELVGVDRSMISRLRRGERLPSARLMAEFARVTKGAIMPNDWFFATTVPTRKNGAE